MPTKPLKRFFVTTRNSVYHVYAGVHSTCDLVVQKIEGRGNIPVGDKIKGAFNMIISRAKGGFVIAGLQAGVQFESSPIVGMFTDKKQAIACYRHEQLEPYDRRWQKQTNTVVERLGKPNKRFLVLDPKYHLTVVHFG